MAQRLIPPRIKQKQIIFSNLNIFWKDVIYLMIVLSIVFLIYNSPLEEKYRLIISVGLIAFGVMTIFKPVKTKALYEYFGDYILYSFRSRIVDLYKDITIKLENDLIDNGSDYIAILEIDGIDFSILSELDQDRIINNMTNIYSIVGKGKIVKFERKIDFSNYISQNEKRLESYLKMDQKLYDIHIKTLAKRLLALNEKNNVKEKEIKVETYYLIIYNENKNELNSKIDLLIGELAKASLKANRLKNNELLKFHNNFYETESKMENITSDLIISEKMNYLNINDNKKFIATFGDLPLFCSNAWVHRLFEVENVKVIINFTKSERRLKILKDIDDSIRELRSRLSTKGITNSTKMKTDYDIASLQELQRQVQMDTQELYKMKLYVIYDMQNRQKVEEAFKLSQIGIDKLYYKQAIALKEIDPYDFKIDLLKENTKDMQGETLSSSFPFISKRFMDQYGQYLGYNSAPVFFDQFTSWKKIDARRKNANMVCIGESGGGKSYFTKALNLMHILDNKKVFILDPENEYSHMAKMLNGNIIDVGGLKQGRINPLQIFTSLESEAEDSLEVGHVSNHIQFLEEFFTVVIKEIDQYGLSYLKLALRKLYFKFNIIDNMNLENIKSSDYPILNDLYDVVVEMLKDAENNELSTNIEKEILIKLQIRLKDFIDGSIYANLWNGYTTLEIKNEFTVFNFQSLFSSNNFIVANGQMLLIIRILMQEVIKNKNENEINGKNKNVVITIDEAHQFIDPNFPVALNFMAVMVRRIRKYGGAMIITTQNIRDFIGQSESARVQATTIINNCAYSVIFGLKQDGIISIDNLYKKGGVGGLTKNELEFIATANQGEALFIVSPQIRFLVHIELYKGEENIIERIKNDNI